MSVMVAGDTKFYILVTFYSSVLKFDTTVSIYDTDIVLESFEAHKSICSDGSFRFGGCVSEWVKFTTAVTTYKVGTRSYPIPWEDATIQLGFGKASGTPGYTDVTYLGTYTGTEYKLNAKHTQVTVTAYDLMYKLVNYDMTSWYTSYVASYPSGRALTSFYTDFMNELTTQVGISTYDTPAVFSNVQYSARYTWQPYPRTPVDDGNGGTYMQEMTLFDGTVTGGMLLKGLCEATGTNAYMSAEGTKVALYDLAYYNNTNFYFPLESYSDLDYGAENLDQPSTFRITAYNITYTSSPGSTDYYPITDNWVFNSMANIEIIDDPDIGDDSTPIQSIANLLNVRYRQVWRPAVLTSFGTTTVGGVEYDVKYLEIGTTAAIRLSDNTLIYSPRMQRDMYGIVGVRIEHTALRPYNWRKDGGIDAENASIASTNEIGSKISSSDSTGTVTWTINPSGWDVQVNGSSVLEIDGNGLSLSGYAPMDGGLTHNGIYRGENLGTITSTAELETFLSEHDVSSGAFTDLYLGDYVTIKDGTYNGVWMIAGFDTQYNKGNSPYISTHHLSMIPRITLGAKPMNSTATTGVSQNSNNPLYATTGGVETAGYQAYYGSDMNQIYIPQLVTALDTILSTHLLSQNILLSNITSGGMSNNWAWHTVRARLMSEIEVYGSVAFASTNRGDIKGIGYDTGTDCEKLPVFNFINHISAFRSSFWLRSVASSTSFARAGGGGYCDCGAASTSTGFRPLILIG